MSASARSAKGAKPEVKTEVMSFRFDRFLSPMGAMVRVTDDEGRLRMLEFSDHDERMDRLMRRYYGPCDLAPGVAPAAMRDALDAYFEGELAAIDTIETAANGTAFQRRVWAALREIPAGTTESYGALAARIGLPKAVRAVGLANGSNPIVIVVPCHRVIGANGTLTGYGGGIERKHWLLTHERAAFRPMRAVTPEARLPGL